MGGGRRFFVPNTVVDEEGVRGARTDGRDLRAEFQSGGLQLRVEHRRASMLCRSLPVLGLFESSHMEYEFDRPSDLGGEPSLKDMTVKAIQLMEAATRRRPNGYFLHVEGGRIDHAHHAGNAYRALTDTQELDEAIGAAAQMVDLRETLIIVSAPTTATCSTSRAIRCGRCRSCRIRVKSYEPGLRERRRRWPRHSRPRVGHRPDERSRVRRRPIETACRTPSWAITTDPAIAGRRASIRGSICSRVSVASSRPARPSGVLPGSGRAAWLGNARGRGRDDLRHRSRRRSGRTAPSRTPTSST